MSCCAGIYLVGLFERTRYVLTCLMIEIQSSYESNEMDLVLLICFKYHFKSFSVDLILSSVRRDIQFVQLGYMWNHEL